MNFKNHAVKLEEFLDDELSVKIPILEISKTKIIYKNFKIKQNKNGVWKIYRNNNDALDSFNLKSTALIATKYYSTNNLAAVISIKVLDELYQKNISEFDMFKNRLQNATTIEQMDRYIARLSVAESKYEYAKQQIISKFRTTF